MTVPNSEYSTNSDRPRYRVWYGTNRRPVDPGNESLGYTGERDGTVHYGRAYVHVPRSHEFGSIGSPWWTVRRLMQRDEPLSLESVEPFQTAFFFNELRRVLTRDVAAVEERDVVVYIHGYWTSFEDAAIRAAQIGFDLKVRGITAFFSWPSRDNVAAYFTDEAAMQASETHLEEFLARIVEESAANKVHVIAHSMGNLGFVRSVERVARRLDARGTKFGQIFLATPDVDRDLFMKLAVVYPRISARTTLYVSSKDIALKASSIIRDYARAGYYPPVTVVPAIDTVMVSDIDLSILGHSYFAEAAAVLNDMFVLLRQDLAPQNRQRLLPETSGGTTYWRIAR